jgi:hypothetical protein
VEKSYGKYGKRPPSTIGTPLLIKGMMIVGMTKTMIETKAILGFMT